MLMFRIWSSDTWGRDKIIETTSPTVHHLPLSAEVPRPSLRNGCDAPDALSQPAKRKRSGSIEHDRPVDHGNATKRAKVDAVATEPDTSSTKSPCTAPRDALSNARDAIQHEFCTEILYKHNELRLIEQELAKCQIALEQLRRCHLIPYPVNCPTPEQMLEISAGKGPAMQATPGEPVPRWAPPFGVVDGPYARHYAKWLIPDPSFDGVQPEWQFTAEAHRARGQAPEGRTTRNSFAEPVSATKGRQGRATVGQKLQALSNGYPQPKDKAGPCILKRADGQTVKLVCLDCNRENFSSTQGFINHCRIAHKRDFKSHEEAAVHSGHPIEAAEVKPVATEEKAVSNVTPAPVVATTKVHPLARSDVTDKEVYAALRSRLSESMKLYNEGKLPGITSMPSTAKPVVSKPVKTEKFSPSAETPYLSQLLQRRKCAVNLRDVVADARTQISLDDLTPGEESEEVEHALSLQDAAQERAAARTPVVMRMPARTTNSPAVTDLDKRLSSDKGCTVHMSYVSPPNSIAGALPKEEADTPPLLDDDIDMEEANLSPHALISNNAPSLVSDDGEYDDSDDGSSVSEDSDDLEAESVPDTEINIDYEHDPRGIRRGSSGVSGSVALRKEQKEDAKHVTFVNPVKSKPKERRPRKATQ